MDAAGADRRRRECHLRGNPLVQLHAEAAPDLPTIAESGLPGFEVIGWWGVLAPAKTPRTAVELLNRELRAALELPDVRRTLLDQGMDPAGGTPEQFGALIKADMDKWGEIGRRLGVKLD